MHAARCRLRTWLTAVGFLLPALLVSLAASEPRPTAPASPAPPADLRGSAPSPTLRLHGKPGGGAGGTGQVTPAGVERVGAAPGRLTQTGLDVGIAVVDTGLDFGHADLRVAGDCFPIPGDCQDRHGHGTIIGGVIAARNNAIDVVGVASGATLYAVRVFDEYGQGTDATVIAGLQWIADNATTLEPPIRVVNLSFGRRASDGTGTENADLRAAIQTLHDMGITVVASAGDGATEVTNEVPAGFPEVLAIASTTARDGTTRCRSLGPVPADTASYFTNHGAFVGGTGITVSAPGEEREDILRGCVIGAIGVRTTRLGGGTTSVTGTSAAAAHVSGVVALMLEAKQDLAPETIRCLLRQTADHLGVAPLLSPTSYEYDDGEREGIAWAPGAVAAATGGCPAP